ncbi:MAG TPA: recombinase family protein [Candidatus Magasanikbacteria bacterium]|nr:recombinase family protein [Candidatus Magasanikbacteria bacterium]
MKKVAYYARVSTSLQEEKGTIDSQKHELIQQIKKDGNVLVKEYIDNGWSGARLDRPALDQLRNDIKTDEFEVVYFYDTDRIARDVTYQRLIISELLKYNKEIIIKGKNYKHNPENNFTLTVFGAVSELEKAKILERFMRGRREKARKGAIVDNANMYGYRHITKTETKDGCYEVDEKQAETVRLLFETYAYTDTSLNGLVKILEGKGVKTATGKSYWKAATIRGILKNSTYYGEHYFNKSEKIESEIEKERYSKTTKTKTQLKDREEWISVAVPPIISKELFEAVQIRLSRNKKNKRSGGDKYLLSGVIECGECKHIYSGTQWKGVKYYKCNHRDKRHNHINKEEIFDCKNQAINGEYIENLINQSVLEKILKPQVIKRYVDILQRSKSENIDRLNKRKSSIQSLEVSVENKKRKILDLYADNFLSKQDYMEKIQGLDRELVDYSNELVEITNKIELLEKRKEISHSINVFCDEVRNRFVKLNVMGRKLIIQNLLSQVILHKNDKQNKVIIRGFLPLGEQNVLVSPNYCISNT